MSKVILKVEVDEEAYKQIKGDSVCSNNNECIISKSSSAYYALNAIINATTLTECDDAVSRQAVIVEIRNLYPDIPFADFNNARLKWTRKYKPYLDCEEVVKGMPSVLPKREQGEWILDETDNSITCNKCACVIYANDIMNGEPHFCPNCGSRNGD